MMRSICDTHCLIFTFEFELLREIKQSNSFLTLVIATSAIIEELLGVSRAEVTTRSSCIRACSDGTNVTRTPPERRMVAKLFIPAAHPTLAIFVGLPRQIRHAHVVNGNSHGVLISALRFVAILNKLAHRGLCLWL